MRLLDRMIASGFEFYNYEGFDEAATAIYNELQESELVVIDNVAEYFFDQRTEDDFTTADFPCVMLPFDQCFVEFRFPSRVRAIGCEEVGVLLMMSDPEVHDKQHPEVLNQPGTKYNLIGEVFIRQPGTKKVVLLAQVLLPVGHDGQILSPAGNRIHAVTNLFTPGITEEEKQKNFKFIHQLTCFPIFLALSFMHCRNVRMETKVPPTKLSKSYAKKKGRPLLRYRVLQIDHMKSVLEREGSASTGGLKKALHICRGHFATYGQDGKGLLFGKLAGRFWMPMHTRGSAAQGVVLKDYNVK